MEAAGEGQEEGGTTSSAQKDAFANVIQLEERARAYEAKARAYEAKAHELHRKAENIAASMVGPNAVDAAKAPLHIQDIRRLMAPQGPSGRARGGQRTTGVSPHFQRVDQDLGEGRLGKASTISAKAVRARIIGELGESSDITPAVQRVINQVSSEVSKAVKQIKESIF